MCIVARTYASFTGVPCMIRGNLYINTANVSFLNRDDLCNVVNENVSGNIIMLWSNRHWVMIVIPKEFHGIFILQYSWGSDYAYINNQSIRVEWGLVMRG